MEKRSQNFLEKDSQSMCEVADEREMVNQRKIIQNDEIKNQSQSQIEKQHIEQINIEMKNFEQESQQNIEKQEVQEQLTEEQLLQQQKIIQEKIDQIKQKKQGYNICEHLMNLQMISAEYKISNGLNDQQINERREEYGLNQLTPVKKKPAIIRITLLFGSLFNVLLQICAISAFISYALDSSTYDNIYVGCVLYIIVIQDVVTNFIQEQKSNNLMSQFSKMMPLQSKVIRKGKTNLVPANQLVPGDLVKISCGDKIPADIRLIAINGLKTELSALNGESEPVECQLNSQNDDPMYSKNVIFNSCLIVEGEALGIVIRTGDNTFIGSIANQTANVGSQETTLQKEIKYCIKLVFLIGLIQAIIILIVGISNGMSVLNAIVNGFVLVLIANIPQGLPSTVSFSLNLMAKKMVKQKIFVKQLQTIETMGSSTLIASDKTGTLTQNKMSVQNVWFDNQIFNVNFIMDKKNEFQQNEGFSSLFKIQALCNRAFFKQHEEENEDEQQQNKINEDDPLFKASNFQDQQKEQNSLDDLQVRKVNNPLHQSSKNVGLKQKSQIQKLQGESFALKNKLKQQSFNISGKNINVKDRNQMVDQIRQIQSKELQMMAQLEGKKIQKREREIVGDASETALMRYCDQISDIEEYRYQYPKIFEIPFNSKNKWQLSIHQQLDQRICVLKGAPEIILKKCSYYKENGQTHPINPQFIEQFNQVYENFARQGQRVLGFCYIDLGRDTKFYDQSQENYPQVDFVFAGLSSLIDPPKVGVDEAIRQCKLAGIKVFMVTGDHPLTAEAIARKIGIIKSYQTKEELAQQQGVEQEEINEIEAGAAIIYGPDMVNFTEEKWNDILLKQEIVFARISPQQKVEIVQKFQEIGEIVAVTGDGVNDSIALKKSNIGIAMGEGGSAVAKEAADVLFMDDNFSSILLGIEQGRLLFDNLKKAIAYIMTHLWPELLPLILTFIFNLPLGLSPLQLLSIDLFTELAPAISLSYEEKEDKLMLRPPRNQNKDRLFSKNVIIYSYGQAALIECIFCFLAYCQVFWSRNILLSEISGLGNKKWDDQDFIVLGNRIYNKDSFTNLQQTAATSYYITLVMSQFVHLWVCRTRTASIFTHGFNNILAIYGGLIEVLLLCFFVYTPSIQTILSSKSVDYNAWLFWLPCGFTLILWGEIRKFFGRKKQDGFFNKYLNY